MQYESADFVSDLNPKDALSCRLVRSTVDRATILSLSYPADWSDVQTIGPDDLPGAPSLEVAGSSMPLLVGRDVAFRGQALLILCGPDPKELEDYERRIDLRYADAQPLSFDAPLDSQIVERRELVIGRPDVGFAEATRFVEGQYATGPQEHGTSDVHGAIAAPHGDGVVIYTPTQWPFHVRQTVAAVLGLPERHVVVQVTRMSAHRDSRLWFPSLVAAYAAVAAWKTGRPVRLLLSKEEAAAVGPRRAPSKIAIRTGLGAEGSLVAADIKIAIDGGAFPLFGEELLERAIAGAAGVYACRNVRVEALLFATSTPPTGALCGIGSSQGFFASETHAARIAEIAETDPLRWKSINLLRSGQGLPIGGSLTLAADSSLLDRVAESSGFARKFAAYEFLRKRRADHGAGGEPLRGIGLATAYQGSGLHGNGESDAAPACTVRLESDGSLTILTSGVSADTISERVWIRQAGEILGLDVERIRVAPIDTGRVPDSGPSLFGRNITVVRELIEGCCRAIARRRFRSGLPIEIKKSLSRSAPQSRTGGLPFHSLSWAAAAVETEVDRATLEVGVRGVWIAIACGRVFDEPAARRTVENGLYLALRWCSAAGGLDGGEAVRVVPRLSIEFLPAAAIAPSGGIDELAGNVVPSAFVSSVAQATGRYFDSLPITAAMVHRYLEPV